MSRNSVESWSWMIDGKIEKRICMKNCVMWMSFFSFLCPIVKFYLLIHWLDTTKITKTLKSLLIHYQIFHFTTKDSFRYIWVFCYLLFSMACQTCQIPNVKASLINVIMILVIGVYYLPIEHINNSTIIQIIILPLY